MARSHLSSEPVFGDYRYTQRIAVAVRWFLLGTWLFLHNYRPDLGETHYYINNGLALGLAGLNGYVQWRILVGRPITRPYVLALSAADLAFITTGIGVSSRFENSFFVLYYPALLGLALVFPSRRLSFGVVTLVAIAYGAISVGMEPGVSYADKAERTLIIRIGTMFGVVAAANLMARIERTRRSVVAAQQERSRIAREIHDGIAQSIYMLGLHLETCVELAQQRREGVTERLEGLVAMAKQTLLEVRHYIFDLKPYLAGEKGLIDMVESQLSEFNKVSGVQVTLNTTGTDHQVAVPVATSLYRVTQEALANTLKHARAGHVNVLLAFAPDAVELTVEDDGQGFDSSDPGRGFGLENMRERAEESGGSLELQSTPGQGTRVVFRMPC